MQKVDFTFTVVAVMALAVLTLLVVADVSLRYGVGQPLFLPTMSLCST